MRNLAAGLVALAMSSMAAAGPTLECVRGSAGDGIYGFTFAVHGNDGQQKSFFVEMTYEGVQGGLIQQVLAFGNTQVDKEADAQLYDGTPPANYEMDLDSWFMDEVYLDVLVLTEGPDHYHIESGTGGGLAYEDVEHAYIACTGPVAYDGVIYRMGQTYPVSGVCTPQPGDANLDGCVDGLDYAIWSNNYEPFAGGKTWGQGDLTADAIVDGVDYVVWSHNYGVGCPAAGSVPEPTGFLLLALGGLALIRRKP